MASQRSTRLRTSLLLVALLTVLAGCGPSTETGAPVKNLSTSDDDGYHGILLDDSYSVADQSLTDTAGRSFKLADQQQRTLVFFGYTNCPDICQVVMSTIASAVARLSEAERKQVQVVFVTTDPARDSRTALRTYLDRFNPDFIGVTGSLERIDTLARTMDVFVKKGQKLPSGGYEVDHSTVVVAVDDGVGDLVWTGATSPSDMSSDLTKILKADA